MPSARSRLSQNPFPNLARPTASSSRSSIPASSPTLLPRPGSLATGIPHARLQRPTSPMKNGRNGSSAVAGAPRGGK